MPVLNGFEVQARLVEFGVPVVIITATIPMRHAPGRWPAAAAISQAGHDQVLLDAIELALGLNANVKTSSER